MKLLARYPNNTKLLDSGIEDEFGNTQLLAFENGELLNSVKVSGVVYINERTFQVYSGKDQKKQGIFKIGQGFDWDAETPRQKYNDAHEKFRQKIDSETKNIDGLCYCSFPRIIDYIENRGSDDGMILKQNFQHNFLSLQDSHYDEENDARASQMICKVCNSEYEWKYRERGIDSLRAKSIKAKTFGEQPEDIAPNFLKALFDEVFCRTSYIYREKLEKADLKTTINYLFQRKK
ncbi:MAG: hypothetical protein ACI8XB_002883 [Patiriisocius sp.]|jgi:hypothetical protein